MYDSRFLYFSFSSNYIFLRVAVILTLLIKILYNISVVDSSSVKRFDLYRILGFVLRKMKFHNVDSGSSRNSLDFYRVRQISTDTDVSVAGSVGHGRRAWKSSEFANQVSRPAFSLHRETRIASGESVSQANAVSVTRTRERTRVYSPREFLFLRVPMWIPFVDS